MNLRKNAGAAEPEWRALRALEREWTPELRRRIERALEVIRKSPLSRQALAHLERGDLTGALQAMPWGALRVNLEKELRPVLLLLQGAGVKQLGPAGLGGSRGPIGELVSRFDLVNPAAVRSAALQAADLVTNITEETKQAVRAVIVRGQQGGATVRDMARDIRQLVGLNRRQAVAVQNLRARLTEQGAKPDRIEAVVERATQKALRYRATMIARTETIQASNEGQRALWKDAVKNGDLDANTMRQVWVASADACPICRSLDGRTVRIGQTYAGGVVRDGDELIDVPSVEGPPSHPNCRCALALERT